MSVFPELYDIAQRDRDELRQQRDDLREQKWKLGLALSKALGALDGFAECLGPTGFPMGVINTVRREGTRVLRECGLSDDPIEPPIVTPGHKDTMELIALRRWWEEAQGV